MRAQAEIAPDFEWRFQLLFEPILDCDFEPQRTQRPQRPQRRSHPILFSASVGYRFDPLVDDVVVVEIKAVAKLAPIHRAQLLSYLGLSERQLGLLINFHVRRLKDGITRMAHLLT
jgi:hypothetical protein